MKPLLLSLLLIVSAGAFAQDWHPAAIECGQQVGAELGCASCSSPVAQSAIARCVIKQISPSTPKWIVDACVAKVNSTTQNRMGIDRVPPILSCAHP